MNHGKKEEEVAPSDLWLALTQVPRPYKVVPLPRFLPGTRDPIGEVAMWPLTQQEQMACNAGADKFARELLREAQKKDEQNLGYTHTFANETAVQVLARACRDASNLPDSLSRPAFPSPKLMRETFTTDEIGVLFSAYTTVQAEVGPIIANMSQEEFEAYVLKLEEGGSTLPFDSLSWETQRTLVRSLASQVVSCWMAMSSAGMPLEIGSTAREKLQQRLAAKVTSPTTDESSPE